MFHSFHPVFKITCYQVSVVFRLQAGCAFRFPASRIFQMETLLAQNYAGNRSKIFQSSNYFEIFTVCNILDHCKVSKG